ATSEVRPPASTSTAGAGTRRPLPDAALPIMQPVASTTTRAGATRRIASILPPVPVRTSRLAAACSQRGVRFRERDVERVTRTPPSPELARITLSVLVIGLLV